MSGFRGLTADILAFEARRKNEPPPNPILEALDALALALTDYGNEWSDRERNLYETATAYLCHMGTDSSGKD
jgi:hypothetical protein